MIATVTLPVWLALLAALVCVLCLFTALRSLDALRKVEAKWNPGDGVEELMLLAEDTQKWLELADRLNGTKAAVFGIVGVLLGAVGGLSADWVAHGTWSSGTMFRTAVVLLVLAFVTSVAFFAVAKLKVAPRLKGGHDQRTDSAQHLTG